MAENAANDPDPVDMSASLMAHHQRLDATTGREVVFCYACQAEWWRDENGIMPCPSCGQEITEIVDPNSDIRPPPLPPHPRQIEPASQSTMDNAGRHSDGSYSDPEEDDIQRYIGGSMPDGQGMSAQLNPRRRQRADSDGQEAHGETASAFTTLMHSLLAPALMSQRPRTPNSQTPNSGGNPPSNQAPSPNPNRPTLPFGFFGPGGGGRGPRPGAMVTTRIVLSNGQGPPVTHVYGNMPGNEPVPDLATYVPPSPNPLNLSSNNNASAPSRRFSDGDVAPSLSGSVGSPDAANPGSALNPSPAAIPGAEALSGPSELRQRPRLGRYNTRVLIIVVRGPADDARRLFTEMMTNMGGPAAAYSPGERAANPFEANPFAAILASLLNPGAAVHGDAVYTQEALDRVITQLMEQHQSSGAAPPAPAEAIAKLPLRKADEKILGTEGKAACPVCMEDVVWEEEVLELPCKHWFHEECAKSWLNEHNTCPICRNPISEDAPHEHERGDPNGPPRGQSSSNNPQPGPPPPYAPPAFTFFNSGPRRTSNESRPERLDRLDSIRRAGGVTYDEEHTPNIPGAFQTFTYEPPSQRITSPRLADGAPGGRSFADPNSGAFRDFLNAPPRSGIGRLSEEEDRHGAERAGLRLRREHSFPLEHEHHPGPAALAHNPYVTDNFDGIGLRGGRDSGDAGSWRTPRSGVSRDSRGGNASGERQNGVIGIGNVLGGLWRRFSGQDSQGNGNENGNGNNQGR